MTYPKLTVELKSGKPPNTPNECNRTEACKAVYYPNHWKIDDCVLWITYEDIELSESAETDAGHWRTAIPMDNVAYINEEH